MAYIASMKISSISRQFCKASKLAPVFAGLHFLSSCAMAQQTPAPLPSLPMPKNLFGAPDTAKLKTWFSQNGAPRFVAWRRDAWAPILDASNTEQTPPSPLAKTEKIRSVGGAALFSSVVLTSGSAAPLVVQVPPTVVLKDAQTNRVLNGTVRAVGSIRWRDLDKNNIVKPTTSPLFSADDIREINVDLTKPEAERRTENAASIPTQILNWSAIKAFPTVTLAPMQSVVLWIEWKSVDAPAGHYVGALKVSDVPASGAKTTQSVSCDVTVEKPRLSTADIPPGQVYFNNRAKPLDPYLRDLQAHGARWNLSYPNVDATWRPVGFDMVQVGAGRFWTTNGGKWYSPDDARKLLEKSRPEFEALIEKAVQMINVEMKTAKLSNDEWCVEIWDEPYDSIADIWVETAKVIKRVSPQTRIVANPMPDWNGAPTSLQGTFVKLAPYTDFWWPSAMHLSVNSGATLKFMKATGQPVAFYGTPGVFTSKDETGVTAFYRQAGLLALYHELDGAGFWSVDSSYGDQWDDTDKGDIDWPDAAVFYHGPLGPMPTRNWEAWRRGLEEAQMGRLLGRILGSIAGAQKPAAQTLLAELHARAGQAAYGDRFDTIVGTDAAKQAQDAAVNLWIGGTAHPGRYEEFRAWMQDQILKWWPISKLDENGYALGEKPMKRVLPKINAILVAAAIAAASVPAHADPAALETQAKVTTERVGEGKIAFLTDGQAPDKTNRDYWSPQSFEANLDFVWDKPVSIEKIKVTAFNGAPYASPSSYFVKVWRNDKWEDAHGEFLEPFWNDKKQGPESWEWTPDKPLVESKIRIYARVSFDAWINLNKIRIQGKVAP